MNSSEKRNYAILLVVSVLVSGIVGGLAGFMAADTVAQSKPFLERIESLIADADRDRYATPDQSSIVGVVEKASPAVVSIIVSKDLPNIGDIGSNNEFFRRFFGNDFERFFGSQPQDTAGETEKQEVGGGSGFIVTADGMIVTNKHVVEDEKAEYTVLLNSGERKPAKVLARDPSNDMAILKIDGKDLPTLPLDDSGKLKVGQSVIAIGNALAEFRNTVSTGVISGLSRSITAFGQASGSERLIGLIQTDASINPGNSGGPLLDSTGTVIGINVAVAQGAQNIGFAIPISQVRSAIESVQENGRLIRAYVGVRYVAIDADVAKKEKLAKDYGAWVVKGSKDGEPAVLQDSPADKAGLKEDDIILEADGKKITTDNPLSYMIADKKPGDSIEMKVWRDGKEITLKAILEEMK